MQIDWWTFALQTINFVVLVWLLWRVLYKPVREVIEKRKALAESAFAQGASSFLDSFPNWDDPLSRIYVKFRPERFAFNPEVNRFYFGALGV